MHGKDAIIEDVSNWPRVRLRRPCAALLPIPDAPSVLVTYAFETQADGATRFEVRFGEPKPEDRPFFDQVWPTVRSNFQTGLEILRTMMDERAAADVADVPSAPVSRGRFLREPVHPH